MLVMFTMEPGLYHGQGCGHFRGHCQGCWHFRGNGQGRGHFRGHGQGCGHFRGHGQGCGHLSTLGVTACCLAGAGALGAMSAAQWERPLKTF
jgi:hypothetical protein